ncbi:apolipoprotein N-acyltransferase [Thioalkalivibrio sp. ALM2T]|uniref:apolipoprotein N-acyltransferase n=1 Tax=Thioalkalivibrio sp. ALM2T TaxID=1158184 RepID=UPI00035D43CA|nr:apolipoprotein N-acyltransferase [Thioalkalivibrio sp. ALM2T]
MSALARAGLLAGSATLFHLSFPEGPLPGAFILLAIALLGLALQGLTIGAAAASGLLAGLGYWLPSLGWVVSGAEAWLGFSWILGSLMVLGLALLHAAPYALFAGAAAALALRLERPAEALLAAGLLTVALSFSPQIMPGHFAYTLLAHPLLAQIVDLGGIPLLLFFSASMGFLATGILIALSRYRLMPAAPILLGLLVVTLLTYGSLRLEALERAAPEHSTRLGLVQPNIPVHARRDDMPTADRDNDIETAIEQTRDLHASDPDLDLVIWPEAAMTLQAAPQSWGHRALASLADEIGVPILVNGTEHRADLAQGTHNVALLFEPDAGLSGTYRKRKLVPFGEYLPFEAQLPWLRERLPHASRFTPGQAEQPLTGPDGVHLAPTICFESLFANLVRENLSGHAGIIVNISNHAWFGSPRAADAHRAVARARSLENRSPMVMLHNTGGGAVFDATGRVVPGSETPQWRSTTQSVVVHTMAERPFYQRHGDRFLQGLAVLVLLASLYHGWRRWFGLLAAQRDDRVQPRGL